MPILVKLRKKLGEFFSKLFDGAEAAWKKLEPAVKDAMQQGSEIVNLINKNKDLLPEDLLKLIDATFPNLPIEKIKEAIDKVATEYNLVKDIPNADILTTLQAVQQYLKGKQGGDWATASDAIAKVIAIFLAPAGTKATSIISLIWFVYQRFVKK